MIDYVMCKATSKEDTGIIWNRGKLQDLDFADAFVLLDTGDHAVRNTTTNVKYEAANVGLRISQKKMKIMIIERVSDGGAYVIHSEEYDMINGFVYLRSIISIIQPTVHFILFF